MTENSTSEGLDNRNILGTGWTNLKSKNWPLKKTSQHWDWQSLNSSNEMTENSTSKGPDDWNIWAQAEQTPKAKNWQLKNLSEAVVDALLPPADKALLNVLARHVVECLQQTTSAGKAATQPTTDSAAAEAFQKVCKAQARAFKKMGRKSTPHGGRRNSGSRARSRSSCASDGDDVDVHKA